MALKSKQVQEFKETKIGDVCPFAYGKGLPERERNIGKFPVYGSNGIVGWHDTSFLNGPCIIIGRKGSIGKIHYSENSCWPIDTTFYIVENENYHLKFIFYLLKFLDLENMDSDTSVPGLNRTAAHELEINIPEKIIQNDQQIPASTSKSTKLSGHSCKDYIPKVLYGSQELLVKYRLNKNTPVWYLSSTLV